MFFALSACISSYGATLVKHSLDKKVFVSGVETSIPNFIITATTFQAVEFDLVRCTSILINNITNFKIAAEQNYKPIQLEKTIHVQNKDVVWLTNMKSK